MLLWHAIFKDKPQDSYCTEEQAPPAAVLKRFEHAMALGMHDGGSTQATARMLVSCKSSWGHGPSSPRFPLRALGGLIP
jgi:hypothetical protein